MKFKFLDRSNETARITRLLKRKEGSFGVLYGRRRCGKSRLLIEVIPQDRSVYFVGDDREASLQRNALAAEIARVLVDFDRVVYPDWNALLQRWWETAKPGMVLVLDEFPALVSKEPALPSLLQKLIDRNSSRSPHLIVAGSSQRLMQGLVIDRSAPLFGRATEILKIDPLQPGWITEALGISDPRTAIEAFAVWGGVPRYWELAADEFDQAQATCSLVLDPLGVLHDEPRSLLLDDLRDTTQAASILSLIGRGCHRVSEIAGRLGKPATSLGRPLQRLMEMGLVSRDQPFGHPLRGGKRTLYHIRDPFLRFWFRFVEPNRSRLESGRIETVEQEIHSEMRQHFGSIWEDLARLSVPFLKRYGGNWMPAHRWWGSGLDQKSMEIDVVAEDTDSRRLLIGEVKWKSTQNGRQIMRDLKAKIARLPFTGDKEVIPLLWLPEQPEDLDTDQVVTASDVLKLCR